MWNVFADRRDDMNLPTLYIDVAIRAPNRFCDTAKGQVRQGVIWPAASIPIKKPPKKAACRQPVGPV